nr:PTS system sac EIIBC component [Klebsiella pneumoniae]
MVKTYGWVDPSNALYIMLDMCSSAAFIILPILIGFTAAREFGGNPIWARPSAGSSPIRR